MLKLFFLCLSIFFFFNNVASAYSCRGRRTDLLVRCRAGICEQGFLFQYKSTEPRCQNFIFNKTGEEKELEIMGSISSFDFQDQDGMSLYEENRTGIFSMCDVASKRLALSDKNHEECFQLKNDKLIVNNVLWASYDALTSNNNCRDSYNCNSFVKTDYPYDLNLNQVISAEITKYDQIESNRMILNIFYYFIYLFMLPAILIYLRINNKWIGFQKKIAFFIWLFTGLYAMSIVSLGDGLELLQKISIYWFCFLYLYISSDRVANFINKLFRIFFKKVR